MQSGPEHVEFELNSGKLTIGTQGLEKIETDRFAVVY